MGKTKDNRKEEEPAIKSTQNQKKLKKGKGKSSLSVKIKHPVLKFRDFLELQASLLPAVSFAPGSIAFYDTVRTWNSFALMFPERCADVIVWSEGAELTAIKNDLSNSAQVTAVLQDLSKRSLANLDDSLRSDTFRKEQEKQAKHIRKIQAKSKVSQEQKTNSDSSKQQPGQPEKSQTDVPINPVLNGMDLPPDVIDSLNNASIVAENQVSQENLSDDDSEKDTTLHIPSHAQ